MLLAHCQPQCLATKAWDSLQLAKITAEVQSLLQRCTVHGPECLTRFLNYDPPKRQNPWCLNVLLPPPLYLICISHLMQTMTKHNEFVHLFVVEYDIFLFLHQCAYFFIWTVAWGLTRMPNKPSQTHWMPKPVLRFSFSCKCNTVANKLGYL